MSELSVTVAVHGEIHRHGPYEPVTETEHRRCGHCRKGIWRFWRSDKPDPWVHPSRERGACRAAMANDNTLPDERHP